LILWETVSRKKQKQTTRLFHLFKDALDEIKNSRNEEQRVEFHIALGCVMPTWETQGTNNGWISRICDRLGLKRGKRSKKNGGRPYESDQTVDVRAQCNKDVELHRGLPPRGSETSTTRLGDSRRPSYAQRGSEKTSECGQQYVCTLRGKRQ
jgi:hypothetical protein